MWRRRILVAEDDDSVRCMLVSALTMGGYSVSAVDNGRDLLRLAQSAEGFDLLLTDILMPRGEGNDIVSYLHANGIHTPTVFITALQNPPPLPEETALIHKPFSKRQLLDTVAAMLEKEPKTVG